MKKTSLNTLNCIFLNADCLTNKMTELEFIIKTETPDIIGINEVLPKNIPLRYILKNLDWMDMKWLRIQM